MAEDGVIRIGTSVDVSGIKAGMSEAEDAVKSSTSNMEGAYNQVAQATVQFASAQANLRNAIKQSVDGTTKHAVAAKSLVEPLQESAAAARSLAAAKAQLAAVTAAETTAENTETQAIRTNMSARMAASAEIRVFEGNMQGSTRAAGAFLTMLPGMSAAMQAAFSIFGAIALVGVFVQMGEALYKAFDMGGERARKTAQDIDADAVSMRHMNDSLDVELDKLQMADAKLEHKPITNGMKTAIDESAAAADALYEKLGGNLRRIEETIKGMQGSALQQAMGIKGGTEYEQTMVEEHTRHLSEQDSVEKQLNESISYGNSLNMRRRELEWRTGGGSGLESPAILENLRTELQATEHLIAMQGQEQRAIQTTIALEAEQKTHNADIAKNEDTRDANKAAQDKLKAIESQYEVLSAKEASINGHGLTAGEGASFWEKYLTTFKAGSEEAKRVMEEYVKAQGELHKQLETIKASTTKGESEDARMSELGPELNKWMTEQAEDVLHAGDRWKEYRDALSKVPEVEAQAKEQISLATVNANEASGAITKLAALHANAAIHAADYAAKLKALNEELARLKSEAADNTANGVSNAKNAAQQQQLQNQIGQVGGQAGASAIHDAAAIQQQISAPYLKAFDQINSGWMKVQNQMMYSTRNLSMEFAKMGQSILISVVDNMEMAALKTVEKELIMRLAHKATVVSNVATDATGAASSEATSKGLAATQGLTAAKLAYQNTYAQVSKWPDVGPVLAPVLASAAFVAVAAFEDGSGYIPRTGMAMLHEGEAVIPAPTMRELRGDGGGGGGGDINIQQHNNWAAGSKEEFRRQLRENAAHVAGAVKQHLRQGGR